MHSRERDFIILLVEDHGVIGAALEEAVQRNGGPVLGPGHSGFRGARAHRNSPMRGALLDIQLGNGETAYSVAE